MDSAYAAAYPELYRTHWWWRVRERILLSRIGELVAGRQGSIRLLDVGCGAGLFFDALQQFGHVEGIESDAESVQRSGIWRSRIVAAELDAEFKPAEPYDVILLLDVLEHVPDPAAVLRAAGRVLRPGGHVLITVPAFTWLWTNHDVLNHHLRRYNAAEMRVDLGRGGLTTDQTRYFFQSLVIPKLLVRGLETLISTPPRVPRPPARGLNKFLQSWFTLEYRLAGWLPFGGSLLAIAHRSSASSQH